MLRTMCIAAAVAIAALGLGAVPAAAQTVTHETTSFTATTRWPCPGHDPVEHYRLTFHDTTFKRDGVRVRLISHAIWRGWITNRTTGALVRDDSNWTEIVTFNATGRREVRHVTVGSVWRLTIPGHGIVVHQSGRTVTDQSGTTSTPFGGFADPSKMCPYV
jgi:hypothetical protein